MACEDFPCCGHEHGCCPDFNDNGEQINMKCTCGATLPLDSRYSICDTCMDMPDSDDFYLDRGDWHAMEFDGDYDESEDDDDCDDENDGGDWGFGGE